MASPLVSVTAEPEVALGPVTINWRVEPAMGAPVLSLRVAVIRCEAPVTLGPEIGGLRVNCELVPCGVTVTVTGALWLRGPLDPVTTTLLIPSGVLIGTATVIVTRLEPVTDVGLNVTVDPPGAPVATRLTVPLKPFRATILRAMFVDAPCATGCEPGIAVSVKSGAAFTVSEAGIAWLRRPLVPVMVRLLVAAGVVADVVTVMTVVSDPMSDAGLKLAAAPEGNPLALSAMAPPKLPAAATVIV